jgi:hypothetical protein
MLAVQLLTILNPFIEMAKRMRKAIIQGNERVYHQSALLPESLHHLESNDEKISCLRPSGKKSEINWADITMIKIRTTDEGPLHPDVFYEIYKESNKPEVVFPQGATGEYEILKALQSKLADYDNGAFSEAMGCTDNREFIIWKKRIDAATARNPIRVRMELTEALHITARLYCIDRYAYCVVTST